MFSGLTLPMKNHTTQPVYDACTLLAAGFCEAMGKSVAGWVCARPRAAFDCGKKLAANGHCVCFRWGATRTN